MCSKFQAKQFQALRRCIFQLQNYRSLYYVKQSDIRSLLKTEAGCSFKDVEDMHLFVCNHLFDEISKMAGVEEADLGYNARLGKSDRAFVIPHEMLEKAGLMKPLSRGNKWPEATQQDGSSLFGVGNCQATQGLRLSPT